MRQDDLHAFIVEKERRCLMKSLRSLIVRVHKRFIKAFVALCVLTVSVFAMETVEMPKEMQTQIKEPRGRTISLKLPLLQPEFHWTFMSRDDFLSGTGFP